MDFRLHGSTGNRFRFLLWTAGLDESTAGLIISTICDNEATPTVYAQASGNIEDITTGGTLGEFSAPTTNKCRFEEVDPTNHPKLYEIQIADARFSVAGATKLVITVTDGTDSADYEVGISTPINTAQIAGSTAAATNLRHSASGMIPAVVDDTAFTPTTTEFETSDITLADADSLQDRRVLWLTGSLKYQMCAIVSYALATGRGHITMTAATQAPSDGDEFIIV